MDCFIVSSCIYILIQDKIVVLSIINCILRDEFPVINSEENVCVERVAIFIDLPFEYNIILL